MILFFFISKNKRNQKIIFAIITNTSLSSLSPPPSPIEIQNITRQNINKNRYTREDTQNPTHPHIQNNKHIKNIKNKQTPHTSQYTVKKIKTIRKYE